MGLFNELYGKDQKVIDDRRKALVAGQVERRMAAGIDSLRGRILEAELEIEELRVQVANGEIDMFPDVIEHQIFCQEAEAEIKLMEAEFDRFFG